MVAEKKKKYPRKDWNVVKRDFISSNKTLKEVAKDHKAGLTQTWQHYIDEGWLEAREKFRKRIDVITTEKLGDLIADDQVRLYRTWANLKLLVDISILQSGSQKMRLKDGSEIDVPRSLPPYQVMQLANVLDMATKNMQLLAGRPTARGSLDDKTLEGLKNDPAKLQRIIDIEVQEAERLKRLTSESASDGKA